MVYLNSNGHAPRPSKTSLQPLVQDVEPVRGAVTLERLCVKFELIFLRSCSFENWINTNLLILLALVSHGNRPDWEVEGVVDADARDGPEQRRRILNGDGGEGKPCGN